MKNLYVLFSVFSVMVLSACGDQLAPRNPENIAAIGDFQRSFVANAEYSTAFQNELSRLNFYAPDNCLQVVRLRSNNGSQFLVVEMSPVPCQFSGLVDDKDVLKRLELSLQPSTSSFELLTQDAGQVFKVGVGTLSGSRYIIGSICTGASMENTCELLIEASLFAGIRLF